MSPARTPLLFCLRVPEFAAQALVRLRPSLRGSAAAVLEGEPPLERCCAATAQARRLGVRHGMTRAELETFAGLTILRRASSEETSAAAALLEMSAQFTPSTEELPRTSAFTLALNMTGCDRIFGTPQAIGHKLLGAARDLGLSARVAVSANLHTAACLVRAAGDILIVVPPGQERARLQPLPLSALDLTPDVGDTLNAWGLRSVGELADLPEIDVISRLGQGGQRLFRLARGEEPHLLVPAEPVFRLEEHLAFDAPVDNLDSLLFVLGPMLDQLIVRARSRALLLASVTVSLHLERSEDAADYQQQPPLNNEEPPQPTSQDTVPAQPQAPSVPLDPLHERTLKPALPLDDRTLLLKLLQLDLQAHPAPAGIVAITLNAIPGPRPGVQSGLFSPQLPEPMRLEVTVARIQALVGEGRVGRAVLTDTHQPEAFRMDRLVFSEAMNRRHRRLFNTAEDSPPASTGVALRRLRPPKAVQVWQEKGRVQAFSLNESTAAAARYTVRHALGPWRRSGDWWSGAAWSREEWDIDATAPDGTRLLCLLTHDLLQLAWHMEALYD